MGLVEALRRTVTGHPVIQVWEQDVARQQALQRQARGQFDTVLSARAGESRLNSALFGVAQRAVGGSSGVSFGYTDLSAGATRQLRNGITVSPVVEISRQGGVAGGPAVGTERVGFSVTVPLLRGRGREATSAEERATAVEAEAAAEQLQYRLTELLAETAGAYWENVAAARLLDVYQASESRGRAYLESVRTLVAADKVPRVEISQVEANLAARAAARAGSQQRLAEARGRLAIAQGLSAPGEMPGDAFPKITMPTAAVDALIRSSLARRADLRAIRKLVDAAEIRRRAAVNLAKPGLELSAGAGFSSLQTRSSAFRNGDLSASLSYEFLRGNNLRQGRLDQAAVESRRESARVVEAERQVRVGVTAYWAALESAAERCGQTLMAVQRFEEALAGEREKYRLGVGSIVDLLTVEDRLTVASALAVEAEANFAAALARLALVSGSILNGQGVVTAEPFLGAGYLVSQQ